MRYGGRREESHDRSTLPADRIHRIALRHQAARAVALSENSVRLGHHDQSAAEGDRAFAPESDPGAAISRRQLSRRDHHTGLRSGEPVIGIGPSFPTTRRSRSCAICWKTSPTNGPSNRCFCTAGGIRKIRPMSRAGQARSGRYRRPRPAARRKSSSFRQRQISRMVILGATAENKPLLEESYLRILAAFEPHVGMTSYLFGSRPSLADFAWFGQLSEMATDPTPMRIMRREGALYRSLGAAAGRCFRRRRRVVSARAGARRAWPRRC